MVARKGKIIYSDAVGFQDKGPNTPMKLDSIFRIYSMTKPLASVAAMMLVEDGVVQLTDPISKFLPAFKDMQVSTATTRADGKAAYLAAYSDQYACYLSPLRSPCARARCVRIGSMPDCPVSDIGDNAQSDGSSA